MIEIGKRKEIISNAISAAICIDDKYASPYSNEEDNDAKNLYQSFREQGKCALDIYKYIDLHTFEKDKDYLLNHKELMILDWELNNEAPGRPKFIDTLKVLENAVSDKNIRCVTIYTQATDLQLITLQIYSYFSRFYSDTKIKDKIDVIVEYIAGILDDKTDIEDGLIFLKDLLKNKCSGFNFLPEADKKKTLKELIREISNHIPKEDLKEICSYVNEELKNISLEDKKLALSYYEITQREDIANCSSENIHSVEVYDEAKYLLIDNTIILVLNKNDTDVNHVYDKITEAISKIPNQRTLLLSLMIKNILYDNIGISGKGLGKVTDQMLLHHWNTYEDKDIDNLIAFIVLCMKEDIAVSLNNSIDSDDLNNLFDTDNSEIVQANCNELALFNQIITFVDKKDLANKEQHKIKTGDIFKLTSRLYEYDKEKKEGKSTAYDEYLICISQSCDCLRASKKIKNNFAFAYGSTNEVDLSAALQNIESKDNYTIINDKTAIKWGNNFFTIYIENNIFKVDSPIDVKINNKDNKLEYIGNLKDFYAQRIINKIFNNALRIGVDLPHYDNKKK